jgi:hypothetical protein
MLSKNTEERQECGTGEEESKKEEREGRKERV